MPARLGGKWGEWYLCYRRVRLGPEGCSRTPIPREPVDSAILDFFQHVALDVAAIKQELVESSDRVLAEARAALEQAERDLIKTSQAVQRIRTYVHDGRLDPEELDLVRAEEQAGLAQVEQLRKREQEAQALPLTDAQDDNAVDRVSSRADHDHGDVAVPPAPGLAVPDPAAELEPGDVAFGGLVGLVGTASCEEARSAVTGGRSPAAPGISSDAEAS